MYIVYTEKKWDPKKLIFSVQNTISYLFSLNLLCIMTQKCPWQVLWDLHK